MSKCRWFWSFCVVSIRCLTKTVNKLILHLGYQTSITSLSPQSNHDICWHSLLLVKHKKAGTFRNEMAVLASTSRCSFYLTSTQRSNPTVRFRSTSLHKKSFRCSSLSKNINMLLNNIIHINIDSDQIDRIHTRLRSVSSSKSSSMSDMSFAHP